jgi:hypothetical protein
VVTSNDAKLSSLPCLFLSMTAFSQILLSMKILRHRIQSSTDELCSFCLVSFIGLGCLCINCFSSFGYRQNRFSVPEGALSDVSLLASMLGMMVMSAELTCFRCAHVANTGNNGQTLTCRNGLALRPFMTRFGISYLTNQSMEFQIPNQVQLCCLGP